MRLQPDRACGPSFIFDGCRSHGEDPDVTLTAARREHSNGKRGGGCGRPPRGISEASRLANLNRLADLPTPRNRRSPAQSSRCHNQGLKYEKHFVVPLARAENGASIIPEGRVLESIRVIRMTYGCTSLARIIIRTTRDRSDTIVRESLNYWIIHRVRSRS